MKAVLLLTIFLTAAASNVSAQRTPLSCKEIPVAAGLNYENGQWRGVDFNAGRSFVLLLEGRQLDVDSVAAVFGMSDRSTVRCQTSATIGFTTCDGGVGSFLIFDPKKMEGGIANLNGSAFTGSNGKRDSILVKPFSCQPSAESSSSTPSKITDSKTELLNRSTSAALDEFNRGPAQNRDLAGAVPKTEVISVRTSTTVLSTPAPIPNIAQGRDTDKEAKALLGNLFHAMVAIPPECGEEKCPDLSSRDVACLSFATSRVVRAGGSHWVDPANACKIMENNGNCREYNDSKLVREPDTAIERTTISNSCSRPITFGYDCGGFFRTVSFTTLEPHGASQFNGGQSACRIIGPVRK